MKVLYNTRYGGFSFSKEFVEEFNKRHPDRKPSLTKWNADRTDPDIIALFEEMGSEWSSGRCAILAIEEIPDDVEYDIHEYDGQEDVTWDIPKDKIIDDLMDILKGRKKLEETSKFTQMMFEKNFNPLQLRLHLITSS